MNISPFFFLMLIVSAEANAQRNINCALNIGGAYFIHNEHNIVLYGEDILNVTAWEKDRVSVNFHLYNSTGNKEAWAENGVIRGENAGHYAVKSSETEFTCIEKLTDRIVVHLKKVQPDQSDSDCQINVWTDLYMPGGDVFQSNPEGSNLSLLSGMRSAIFKNGETALMLN